MEYLKERVLSQSLGLAVISFVLISTCYIAYTDKLETESASSNSYLKESFSSESIWWDADWPFRRQINITNDGEALTDYQIKITLTTSNFNYTFCQIDGADIRFASDIQELNYWIESWNYDGTSVIWVCVQILSGNGVTTIHLYFGNLSCSSTSNGDNTFPFFDYFENQNVGAEPRGWTVENAQWGSFEIDSSSITNDRCGHFIDDSTEGTPKVYTNFGLDILDYYLEFWIKPGKSSDSGSIYYNDGSSTWQGGNIYFGHQSSGYISYYDTSYHKIYSPYSAGNWYFVKVKFNDPSSYSQTMYDDQGEFVAHVSNINTNNNRSFFYGQMGH